VSSGPEKLGERPQANMLPADHLPADQGPGGIFKLPQMRDAKLGNIFIDLYGML